MGTSDVGRDNIIQNTDLMGFIKSISYTIPDESPWEIARGRWVPKYITSAMTFQVIHDSVPGHNTKFYGLKNNYTYKTNLKNSTCGDKISIEISLKKNNKLKTYILYITRILF